MNTSFLAIVKRISSEYGEAVLADPQRLKAFFSDLAKDEPKPLRIAFDRCIEAGAYTALKTAPDTTERAERKGLIVQKVHEEHGLDMGLCSEALDILEAALFADRKETLRCASYGKELQPVAVTPETGRTCAVPFIVVCSLILFLSIKINAEK
jgi:hypothetical protein